MNLMNFQLLTIFLGFQQQEEAVDQIKEKLANAPADSNYELGVVIATYLPFVFLIIFAYVTFYLVKKAKAKKQEE